MCASQRTSRPAKADEVILDEADGLNWPSICHCDVFHLVNKTSLTNHRGHVTPERRLQIIRTINLANGWV